MPYQPPTPLQTLIDGVRSEWQAHTERHTSGGGWGTFRALVSVLQVAASFVLAVGLLLQFPFVLAPFGETHWIRRFVPSLFELGILVIVAAPEWLDGYFFARADKALRAYGAIKIVDPERRPSFPPGEGALRMLWFGQVASRLTNLAVHVIFAVLLSAGAFYAARATMQATPGYSAAGNAPNAAANP
jgi:hypothetical protein